MRFAVGIGVDAALGAATTCAGALGDGLSLGTVVATVGGFSLTARVTPAMLAHRLTQLCGTWCFFDDAITPRVRTSARTASRCSVV